MSLTLHYHPLASFCWKTLVALYENGTPFTPEFVDLSNEEARNRFYKISPTGKFPVIVDSARNQTLLESTILNEYLDVHYPGPVPLIPKDADRRSKHERGIASSISTSTSRCRRSCSTTCAPKASAMSLG